MSSAKLYLDTRTKKKDGKHPLKILASCNGVHTYISTGIDLLASQYDARGGKNGRTWVIEHLRRDTLNRHILSLLASVDAALVNLPKSARIDAKSFRLALMRIISPEFDTDENKADSRPLFMSTYMRCVESYQHARTKKIYITTLNKIRTFCKSIGNEIESLTFEDINRSWLISFKAYLDSEGNAINTIAIDMRNIRHIFNFALDDEMSIPYPFKRVKIEREDTPNIYLSDEQLIAFMHAPCSVRLARYRDIFMLMFLLVGISMVDLFWLRKDSVQNGRIVYRRAKTKKLYSIKLYPEAAEIIKRREGRGDWLLDIRDSFNDHKNYLPYINKALSEIASSIGCGFPAHITTYWARYTWANVAHRISISKDDISIALGHVLPGSRTTDTYVDYDIERADEANRMVIAHIYNKRP